jgi:hypothetical protein
MRDQGRHLVGFHVLANDAYVSDGPEPSPRNEFVISDDDFEPDAA